MRVYSMERSIRRREMCATTLSRSSKEERRRPARARRARLRLCGAGLGSRLDLKKRPGLVLPRGRRAHEDQAYRRHALVPGLSISEGEDRAWSKAPARAEGRRGRDLE